jgi:hypothetical protein
VKRRLFTILSSLSLLLFVAVVVLWVRSYWIVDVVQNTKTDDQSRYIASVRLTTRRGTVVIEVSRPDTPVTVSVPPGRSFSYYGAVADRFIFPFRENQIRSFSGVSWGQYRFGVGTLSGPGFSMGTANVLILPLHFFVAVTSVAPLIWFVMWWKHRVPVTGRCPSCGYDLRATSDRCPECGRVPQSATTRAPA